MFNLFFRIGDKKLPTTLVNSNDFYVIKSVTKTKGGAGRANWIEYLNWSIWKYFGKLGDNVYLKLTFEDKPIKKCLTLRAVSVPDRALKPKSCNDYKCSSQGQMQLQTCSTSPCEH